MAVFRYTAVERSSGARRRGEIAADSAQQVRAALRRMGLSPLRVDRPRPRAVSALAADPLGARAWASRRVRSRRRARLVEFYENVAALLATGTTLADALGVLARTGDGPTASLCRGLAERIRHGGALAAAMSERPDWFDPVDAALVEAAEQTGRLERALTDLAEHAARADELRGRLAGALAYPALLTVFGLGVVIFLTTSTLPQMAAAIADAGAELPAATAALLWCGETIASRWPLLVLAVVAAAAGVVWLVRAPWSARWWLRAPLLGAAVGRAQLAGVGELLARMLESGVPMREALTLVAPTARNAALRGELLAMRARLEAGRAMLGEEGAGSALDPVFRRVLEVGQETGELPGSLRAISARHRASSRRLIDRLAATLEPAAILTLAALIGAVAYAAIAPMLRLAQSI